MENEPFKLIPLSEAYPRITKQTGKPFSSNNFIVLQNAGLPGSVRVGCGRGRGTKGMIPEFLIDSIVSIQEARAAGATVQNAVNEELFILRFIIKKSIFFLSLIVYQGWLFSDLESEKKQLVDKILSLIHQDTFKNRREINNILDCIERVDITRENFNFAPVVYKFIQPENESFDDLADDFHKYERWLSIACASFSRIFDGDLQNAILQLGKIIDGNEELSEKLKLFVKWQKTAEPVFSDISQYLKI